MKYLKKKKFITDCGQSEAYRDNWEAIFGRKERFESAHADVLEQHAETFAKLAEAETCELEGCPVCAMQKSLDAHEKDYGPDPNS